jgi:DNA-binding HxlR family transcriptional regulator
MSKLWDVQPLHTSLVEVLLKRGGSSTDTELLDALKKSYGELSLRELNKTLMRLEVDGIIHVSTLTKNKKRVEFRKT